MKQKLNEVKRMQRLAGVIKENQEEINSTSEMYSFLERILKKYVDETENMVGSSLDWDGDGSNVGINNVELVKDFIDYLQNY